MASQTITNASWSNNTGYIRMAYDDVTFEIESFTYANNSPRTRRVDVYNKQGNLWQSFVLEPGTPETTIPAPNNLNLDPETGALDQWRIETRYV